MCTAQVTGRAMGLAAVGHGPLWLNLSSMSEKDKSAVLDHPPSPNGLFGSATYEAIQQ